MRRRGRFTRQRSLLLKRMQAGMCLMIHRPAMPRKPKWVWRICSTLLKQTQRTVIDENDVRQPACARDVLARAKERPSLIKRARLEYNAIGFFFVKMNIKMRNADMRPPLLNEAICGVFSLPIFKAHIKASSKHICSSILASFLVNFQLYEESSHIFEFLMCAGFALTTAGLIFHQGDPERGRGAHTHLKDLHLFSCMCCRKSSCKLSFSFFLPFSGFISSSAQIGLWESLQQAFNQMWLPLAKPSSQPEEHTLI